MKKKIYLFALMLCVLSCGIVLTACGGSPVLEFKEGAELSRAYNGNAISTEEVLNTIEVSKNQEVTINFYQGETPIDAPINVGDYKVVISIPSKTIEEEFTISQKSLDLNLAFEYNAGTEFSKALTSNEGICSDDNIQATATFESSAVDASTANVVLSGDGVSNYLLNSATATIVPKEITSEVVFATMWLNRTGERTFTKNLSTADGLISGESASLVVKTESHDAGAPITSISITGTNGANYTIKEENVKLRISLKITITLSVDESQTITVYAIYGENKLYKDALGSNAFTLSDLSGYSVTITKIYKTYEGTDGMVSNNVVNVDSDNFGTFIANAKYAGGALTDANGNWIMGNGSNSDALNLTADVALAQ